MVLTWVLEYTILPYSFYNTSLLCKTLLELIIRLWQNLSKGYEEYIPGIIC